MTNALKSMEPKEATWVLLIGIITSDFEVGIWSGSHLYPAGQNLEVYFDNQVLYLYNDGRRFDFQTCQKLATHPFSALSD